EGATFLLGVSQTELKQILSKNKSLYYHASKNAVSITIENLITEQFNEGWYPRQFLIFRIFLLFGVCVQVKRASKQVYEKGVKELQVQLTTYWDYITVQKFKHQCPDLMDDWSCNVVNRLMNLKLMSLNSCCEMSLV
ncbi:hypothetical protein RFI_34480, partial [Reticulomyxa filosa]